MPETPEPHKNSRRPPEAKQRYRLVNWPEYEAGLRSRGDIRIWFDEAAIEGWIPAPSGRRGGQRRYSDLAIEVGLTLRLLFHLPLSSATPAATEGFLGSIIGMLGLTLDVPDHTTFSRRGRTFKLSRPLAELGDGPIDLIVDSSGLKLYGQQFHCAIPLWGRLARQQAW